MEKDTLIKVKNTTSGRVGYTVPDLGNLHRSFMSGETKEVTLEELKKLAFTPGGEALLRNHLTIENKEALEEILGKVEPEYFYTKEDVERLLTSGTIEQFMDFLDFAPEGLINLAKDLAVSTEVSDIRKRDAILKKTGFNVTAAIAFNHEMEEEVYNSSDSVGKQRRAEPISQEKKTPPKYKVTSIQN